MQKMRFEKRIMEEVDGLRKLAAFLPSGKANALLNKCDRITLLSRKAQALVDAPVGSLFPQPMAQRRYEPTNEDIKARYCARRAIFQALMAGRVISLEDSAEFRVSQMHTQMAGIRKEIQDKGLPYILCAREKRPDPSCRGYNEYYLIPKDNE